MERSLLLVLLEECLIENMFVQSAYPISLRPVLQACALQSTCTSHSSAAVFSVDAHLNTNDVLDLNN